VNCSQLAFILVDSLRASTISSLKHRLKRINRSKAETQKLKKAAAFNYPYLQGGF